VGRGRRGEAGGTKHPRTLPGCSASWVRHLTK